MIYNVFIHHHVRSCWGLPLPLLRTKLSREGRKLCHWVKPKTVAEMAGASAIPGILELVQRVEFTASYGRKFNIKLGSL